MSYPARAEGLGKYDQRIFLLLIIITFVLRKVYIFFTVYLILFQWIQLVSERMINSCFVLEWAEVMYFDRQRFGKDRYHLATYIYEHQPPNHSLFSFHSCSFFPGVKILQAKTTFTMWCQKFIWEVFRFFIPLTNVELTREFRKGRRFSENVIVDEVGKSHGWGCFSDIFSIWQSVWSQFGLLRAIWVKTQ